MSFNFQLFIGNNDQDTWKPHCFHRYYGKPIHARYVRIYPTHDSSGKPVEEREGCVGLRAELYGFRKPNDTAMLNGG